MVIIICQNWHLQISNQLMGKYGMLRKSYLQEHRKAKYQILLLQGKLVEHLNQIDAEARDREEQLVKQMMEKQRITEKLKRQDNMEWTRRMNTLCHDAEEMNFDGNDIHERIMNCIG